LVALLLGRAMKQSTRWLQSGRPRIELYCVTEAHDTMRRQSSEHFPGPGDSQVPFFVCAPEGP
jgi:hypothetical protein